MPRCARPFCAACARACAAATRRSSATAPIGVTFKTPDDKHFEIDDKRVAEDERYDSLYVLRTNTRLDPLAVMLRYRELLKVEDIFRTTKSTLDTRPIYHQNVRHDNAFVIGTIMVSACQYPMRLFAATIGGR